MCIARVLPCTRLRWPVTSDPLHVDHSLLRHSPVRIRALVLLFSSFQFLLNPVEVLPTPSTVRRGGAPDTRSSTRVFAQGQSLCWARCPCVVIPFRVIPHVYSSKVQLPSWWVRVFPWQRPSAVSAVYWSHPRLAESTSETSICSTALGQSTCVIYTWNHLMQDKVPYAEPPYAVTIVAFPYLEYAFPVLSIPTVRNSNGCHLWLPLSYLPSQLVWGNLPATAGQWRGSAIVAFFNGISFTSLTMTLCQTWLTWKGRPVITVSVPPLYSRGTEYQFLSEKLMCVCTCSPFIPKLRAECAWRNTHANYHWLVLLTLEGDWAFGWDHIYVSYYDVTSPFPPSGNNG